MNDPHLIILAAGISSRMKASQDAMNALERDLLDDAQSRSKSLIRVGHGGRPFMDYVLRNALDAGYNDIVLVIGEQDDLMREYYGPLDTGNSFHGMKISYAIQSIPSGRTKPLGTADATVCGMHARPDWKGSFVTVCNSDNLYSVGVLQRLLDDRYANAMPAYDRDGLLFERERVERFSIIEKDRGGYLRSIVEKPDKNLIESTLKRNNVVEVSMNIFRFNYDVALAHLEATEFHPVRNEKEIPTALMTMVKEDPKCMFCFSVREHVPDLTSKEDIVAVRQYLSQHFEGSLFGEEER